MAATFGDFLLSGSVHLEVAGALWEKDGTAESAAAVIRAIHTATLVMSRCAQDMTAPQREPGPWQAAAAGTFTALHGASAALEESTGHLQRLGSRTFSPAAVRVGLAARCLAAGRDLLNTHRDDTAGNRQLISADWSPVLGSDQVAGALLTEIAAWSRQLAAWLSQAPAAAGIPAEAQQRSMRACHQLWAAVGALETAGRQAPASSETTRLLHGIPSAILPERNSPQAAELVDELCHQATVSAERLRATARDAARQAHWAPAASADSWQWTAEAAVITSHICGLLLGGIAKRDDLPHMFPASRPRVLAAAQSMARAHAEWRKAAAAWDVVTTDTRGLRSPVIADARDLLLRIGRITFDNPLWTPSRAQTAPARSPDDLAATSAGIRAIIAVVHQAADALAWVAAADLRAVDLANRAARLHVPTRCLPEEYDIPYPFGPAPPAQAAAILDAYRSAADVNARTAEVMEELVITIDAPSALLALARTLGPAHQVTAPAGRAFSGHSRLAATPAQQGLPAEAQEPGPVEGKLIRLGVTDPFILLQAAAVDHAGRDLIAGATQAPAEHSPLISKRSARAANNNHGRTAKAPEPIADQPQTDRRSLPRRQLPARHSL